MTPMRYLKARYLALLLTLLIGAGGDWHIRREAERNSHCFGCGSWHCTAVLIADKPIVFLRIVWIKLTEG